MDSAAVQSALAQVQREAAAQEYEVQRLRKELSDSNDQVTILQRELDKAHAAVAKVALMLLMLMLLC